MRRQMAIAAPIVLAPGFAAAAPAWKSPPGSEPVGGGGAETAVPVYEWVQTGLQLLADYYPYLGIVFVLLVLYLFVKGPSKKKAARQSARGRADEVFFEDEQDHVIPYR